jgi:hypothetical protein
MAFRHEGSAMNTAVPLPKPLADVLQQEFLLLCTRPGEQMHGVEITLERALAVARSLAETGWRVRVQNADGYLEDRVEYEVFRGDAS